MSKIAILLCLILPTLVKADECSPSILSRIFNRPRYVFGVLPKEIKVIRRTAMPFDREVWNQSLRSGETAIAEIYDSSDKLLARSKMASSNLSTQVQANDFSNTYLEAIEKAYQNCDHLDGCTLRLVHTHPPNEFGEDLRFSRNDIRSSYNIKVLLEKMGIKVHMREDIIVSDRNGGIYLFSYTLPKNFTYESGHYWPGSSMLKQLRKNSDAIAAVPDALINRHKESSARLRKTLGVSSHPSEISPEFKKLFPLVDEKHKTIIAIADSSDPTFERPQFGILDSDRNPIADITLALSNPDQFLPLVKSANSSKSELSLFLYGKDFSTEDSIFAACFDLRAILNKMNFKQPLSVHYLHKGIHYQLTFTENGHIINGSTALSKVGQKIVNTIDFSIDNL